MGQVDGARRVINPLKALSDKEQSMVEECVKHLKADIDLGNASWRNFEVALRGQAPT